MAIASGRLGRDEGSDVGFEERIDPELRDGLVLYQALGFEAKDLSGETLATMRTTSAALFAEAMADVPANDRVVRQDRTAPGPGGEVPVRVHRSVDATGTLPALLWIHGGGMIFGNIDQDDLACDAYAEAVGCASSTSSTASPPSIRTPRRWRTATRRCAGWRTTLPSWASIPRGSRSAARARAAGSRHRALARDRGGPAVAFQLLVDPMLDDRDVTRRPRVRGARGLGPPRQRRGRTGSRGRGGPGRAPYAAPARATDLCGPATRLIHVGELEMFRDEGVDYAARLLRAGVPTELHVFPGAYHGWDMAAPQAGLSVRMVEERVEALRPQRALQAQAAAPA